ncbi:MAG: hypothetical protein PHO56_01855 [Patescibacteria group bacterium]|nr:hypothetical protein [Patescibacteria group bacterium]
MLNLTNRFARQYFLLCFKIVSDRAYISSFQKNEKKGLRPAGDFLIAKAMSGKKHGATRSFDPASFVFCRSNKSPSKLKRGRQIPFRVSRNNEKHKQNLAPLINCQRTEAEKHFILRLQNTGCLVSPLLKLIKGIKGHPSVLR